jgi:predicted enzyme related to lactoylglutathione lyase
VNEGISLLVYPVEDIAKAKTLYRALLGTDPYVDGSYYVGFKAGEMEVGLDSHGKSSGPIAYRSVSDIKASLKELVEVGFVLDQDVRDVGGGMLIARVKDADGNTVGLRQA